MKETQAREHGASEKARYAAQAAVRGRGWSSDVADDAAQEGLDAAHDRALGLDRSVCLRDVVNHIRHLAAVGYVVNQHVYENAADSLERTFTEPSSQDREKEE